MDIPQSGHLDPENLGPGSGTRRWAELFRAMPRLWHRAVRVWSARSDS